MSDRERAREWERAYRERKRLGLPSPNGLAIERFLTQVDFHGPIPEHAPWLGSCWIWTGYTHPSGYGRIYADGRAYQAHTFGFLRLVGEIPDGLEPDHLCRNKSCVRPSHLEPVTHLVNCQRVPRVLRSQCHRGHPYDSQNTHVDRRGRRQCRACSRLATARYRAKQVAA